MNRKVLLSVGAVLVLGTFAVSTVSRTSNCGGNSAALAHCSIFATWLQIEFASHHGEFRIANASPEFRKCLPGLGRTHWCPDARFLVLDHPFSLEAGAARQVVYVCDQPFSNVPQRILFSNPVSHAAAFSDGTHGLISTAEFAALDKSHYRDLREIYPGP